MSARPRAGQTASRTAFRLVLEYDGSRFQGWQRQGAKQTAQGVRTVMGALERVLMDAGVEVLALSGSGRTDAGVHALGQVAHLHLAATRAPHPHQLLRIFDDGLPADVAIRSITPCSPSFHARHDALERTYLYQLSLRRSAFAKPYIWWIKAALDLERLREAWACFQGNHDCSAFADLEPKEDPRCQIRSCELSLEGSMALLRVTARHFLRRQVRRMVGAAVHCGLKKEDPARLVQDLAHPNHLANLHWAEKAAPAAGLFLEQVRYPGDPETTTRDPLIHVS